MENKKQCYMCAYFNRFFIKEPTRYKKVNYGRCFVCNYPVKASDSCAKFKLKDTNKYRTKNFDEFINHMLLRITQFRTALEDEINDSK